MDGYVWVTHPDLPDNPPVEQPRSAFDGYWRHHRWVQCDPPADPDDDSEQAAEPAEKTTTTARAAGRPKNRE